MCVLLCFIRNQYSSHSTTILLWFSSKVEINYSKMHETLILESGQESAGLAQLIKLQLPTEIVLMFVKTSSVWVLKQLKAVAFVATSQP